jgi:hypothetical protein
MRPILRNNRFTGRTLATRDNSMSAVTDQPKTEARDGGKKLGALICMVIGHKVAWGPCDRCNRRAAG